MKAVHFLGPDSNGGAANAAVADRFAEEDFHRREWLSQKIRKSPAACTVCGQRGRHRVGCPDGDAARGRPVRTRGRGPRAMCTVPGCKKIEKHSGLCSGHLAQRNRGKPFGALRPYSRKAFL